MEIERPKISSSAFYVYIIPMIIMVLGVLIGFRIGEGLGDGDLAEIISVITGLLFLVLSYFLLSFIDRKRKEDVKQESRVQIKEIIKEEAYHGKNRPSDNDTM